MEYISILLVAGWWGLGISDSLHEFKCAKSVSINTFLRRYGMKGIEYYKDTPPLILVLAALFGFAGLFSSELTKKFIKAVE